MALGNGPMFSRLSGSGVVENARQWICPCWLSTWSRPLFHVPSSMIRSRGCCGGRFTTSGGQIHPRTIRSLYSLQLIQWVTSIETIIIRDSGQPKIAMHPYAAWLSPDGSNLWARVGSTRSATRRTPWTGVCEHRGRRARNAERGSGTDRRRCEAVCGPGRGRASTERRNRRRGQPHAARRVALGEPSQGRALRSEAAPAAHSRRVSRDPAQGLRSQALAGSGQGPPGGS